MLNIIIKAKGFIDKEEAPFIKVNDKFLLEYTLETARKIGYENLYIDTDFREEVAAYCKDKDIEFDFIENPGEHPMVDLVIDTRSVYNANILKRLIKKNDIDHIDHALMWVIKNKDDLKKTDDYFTRLTWNPLGSYYVIPLGEGLARVLSKKTNITPNQVTLFSLLAGIAASILFSFNNYYLGLVAALSLHLFFIFDVTDGYIARLKNMRSPFGAFWDGVVGQAGIAACILGITIGVQKKYQNEWIWIVGFLMIFGSFMGVYLNELRMLFLKNDAPCEVIENFKRKPTGRSLLNMLHFLSGWDVRILVICLCAVLGELIFALIYLCLFNNLWIVSVFFEYARYPSKRKEINGSS